MTESHNLETLTKKPSFQLNSVSVESVDHNSFCRPQFATLTALASCHLLCRSIIQRLWRDGIVTYDISTQQNFVMRAHLMWTISDFPAYGMLSGWETQGKLACPYYMDNTNAFTLQYGEKFSWFDCHRRFLPIDHPLRRSKKRFTKNKIQKKRSPYMFTGHDVWEAVCDFPKVTHSASWATKFPGYGK